MGIQEKQGGAMALLEKAVQQELRRCFENECPDCEVKEDKTYCNHGIRAMEVPAGQLCTHKQYKKPSPSYQ